MINRKKRISLLLTMALTCGMFMPAYATEIDGITLMYRSKSGCAANYSVERKKQKSWRIRKKLPRVRRHLLPIN